mmetsp:Transcript_62333/g.197430  ORF Transcript_62333/g.197430 Transcript_62333/m.197430 type:complete len:393 (-) Transcript_62333:763-1941(-)
MAQGARIQDGAVPLLVHLAAEEDVLAQGAVHDPGLLRHVGNLAAQHAGAAGGLVHLPEHRAHQGRLPRGNRAHHREHLALAHGDVDVFDLERLLLRHRLAGNRAARVVALAVDGLAAGGGGASLAALAAGRSLGVRLLGGLGRHRPLEGPLDVHHLVRGLHVLAGLRAAGHPEELADALEGHLAREEGVEHEGVHHEGRAEGVEEGHRREHGRGVHGAVREPGVDEKGGEHDNVGGSHHDHALHRAEDELAPHRVGLLGPHPVDVVAGGALPGVGLDDLHALQRLVDGLGALARGLEHHARQLHHLPADLGLEGHGDDHHEHTRESRWPQVVYEDPDIGEDLEGPAPHRVQEGRGVEQALRVHLHERDDVAHALGLAALVGQAHGLAVHVRD